MLKRRRAVETQRVGNQILSQLNRGKTLQAISKKLSLSENSVEQRFNKAIESLSVHERARMRKKAGLWPVRKFNPKKVEAVISLSKKVILGEASLMSQSPWAKIIMAKKNPKKLRGIIIELRFTRKSFKSIARRTKTTEEMVKKISEHYKKLESLLMKEKREKNTTKTELPMFLMQNK